MPRLCAFGCEPSGVSLHRFPNLNKFSERFKTWVFLVGGKLDSDSDYEYHKEKRICDIHFADKYKNRNSRLNAEAVPTLHIPGQFMGSVELQQEGPSTLVHSQQATTSQPNGIDQFMGAVTSQHEGPSTSVKSLQAATSQPNRKGQFMGSVGLRQEGPSPLVYSQQATTAQPSGIDQLMGAVTPEHKGPTESVNSLQAATSQPNRKGGTPGILNARLLAEHNYSAASRNTKNTKKDETPLFNTAQVKNMRTQIKNLRSEICRIKKKGGVFGTRLENATKVSQNAAFQQIVERLAKPAQEGMEAIWQVLSKKYGLDAMLTRNFNQDPVENFFGNIRSYGARNNAPNTVAFEGAFNSLLLNNYVPPHSRRANCEEDKSECLQNLDFFLKENISSPEETSDIPEENIILSKEVFEPTDLSQKDAGQRNYVCGWVLTKCLKNVCKSCQPCRKSLLESNLNKNNQYIKMKEYNKKKWLCYPNEQTKLLSRNSSHDHEFFKK